MKEYVIQIVDQHTDRKISCALAEYELIPDRYLVGKLDYLFWELLGKLGYALGGFGEYSSERGCLNMFVAQLIDSGIFEGNISDFKGYADEYKRYYVRVDTLVN